MDSLELIQKMLDEKRITTNEAFIILQDLAKSQTEKQGDDKEIKKVFVPILVKPYMPYQPYQPTYYDRITCSFK